MQRRSIIRFGFLTLAFVFLSARGGVDAGAIGGCMHLAGMVIQSVEDQELRARAQASGRPNAMLDLRGLMGVQAYKDGVLLERATSLAPGNNTVHFSFDAVRADDRRCPQSMRTIGKRALPGTEGGLSFQIAGVAVLVCPGIGRSLEELRVCYALSLDAKNGRVYVPRAIRNRPALIESQSGGLVSTTRSVACSLVDRLHSNWKQARIRERQAREAKRKQMQAREAKMKQMDAPGAGWLRGSGYNKNRYRGPDGRFCKDFLSRYFQSRSDSWITSRSTICQDPDGSWSIAKRY